MLRRGAASPPPRASGAWRASSAPFPRRAGVRRRGAPPSAHRRQWHILFTCCQHAFLLFTCTLAWAGCAHAAHIPRNTQVWCTCGARSCSPATVRCGTAAYVQSAAVECALYGRVSRCRSASLCVCTACMCSVRALHIPRSGQGGCRRVVALTASTHAAGWRARCGAGGSRSARAA